MSVNPGLVLMLALPMLSLVSGLIALLIADFVVGTVADAMGE